MRMLITGGAGFIGSNLTRQALQSGWQVTVLDDLSTGYAENLSGMDPSFVKGSVTNNADIEYALKDVQVVIHLAALGSVPRSLANPLATHHVNATGTISLLEAARRIGVEHVIFASSSSVYGNNPALPKSEREWVGPMSPYAVSKLAAEQYVLAYQHSFGLSTLAFRFFNVYGPGQRAGHPYSAVVPIFLDAVLNGRALPINGDGLNSRDFTYVETVCDVLLDAANRAVTHSTPINLAFGTNTTLIDLVNVIGETAGIIPEIEYRAVRPGDVVHSRADNSLLTTLFPNVHSISLDNGIRTTLNWMKGVSQ